MENILKIRNLTKRFGSFTAVDNISFDIKKGNVYGLLGPNGSRKSTNLQGRPTVYAETDLPPDYHSGCIEWCKQHYTNEDGSKKKGRGACKANCWIDTARRSVEALAKLLTVL